MLILGPVGRGKTRQAYGTVRGLLTTGVRLRWQLITAADMYSALSPRPRVDSEAEFWRLARCPLLIIDDLGADNPSEWARKMTYRLINYRYSERLPTVFTTDLTPAELRAAIGERSASASSRWPIRWSSTVRTTGAIPHAAQVPDGSRAPTAADRVPLGIACLRSAAVVGTRPLLPGRTH